MKQRNHFPDHAYTPWFKAKTYPPAHPGWYECKGFRFNGYIHLKWTGSEWLYFGPEHQDANFPQFGSHSSDAWRGLTATYLKKRKSVNCKSYAGNRYGMLTAIQREYVTSLGGAHWLVQCDCGSKRVLKSGWFTGGNTASCGCMKSNGKSIQVQRPWINKKP